MTYPDETPLRLQCHDMDHAEARARWLELAYPGSEWRRVELAMWVDPRTHVPGQTLEGRFRADAVGGVWGVMMVNSRVSAIYAPGLGAHLSALLFRNPEECTTAHHTDTWERYGATAENALVTARTEAWASARL